MGVVAHYGIPSAGGDQDMTAYHTARDDIPEAGQVDQPYSEGDHSVHLVDTARDGEEEASGGNEVVVALLGKDREDHLRSIVRVLVEDRAPDAHEALHA